MMSTGNLAVLLVLAYFIVEEVAADECHFFREDVCCNVGGCSRGTYFDIFSMSCRPCPPGISFDNILIQFYSDLKCSDLIICLFFFYELT